jgi:hypothetical protein
MIKEFEDIGKFINSTFRHRDFELNEWYKCFSNQSTNDYLTILISKNQTKRENNMVYYIE